MKIGFIGVGAMGQPMLANLVKHEHQIVAYDVVESALDRAVKAGATRVASSAAAAREGQIVITILPSSSHVEAAYLGPGGGIVRARCDSDRLVCDIGREHKRDTLRVELSLDGAGRLALRSPIPQLSIGFFTEPHSRAVGLMLGLSAYRRVASPA